jgi:glycosyltransferase involved in cell wall biosynthesis
MPSAYEGFGLPLVEAMHCGAPCLAWDTSSLPEVLGGAGVLVSPSDVEQTSDWLIRIDEDSELHLELSRASLERAQSFSWSILAKTLKNLVEELAGFEV